MGKKTSYENPKKDVETPGNGPPASQVLFEEAKSSKRNEVPGGEGAGMCGWVNVSEDKRQAVVDNYKNNLSKTQKARMDKEVE